MEIARADTMPDRTSYAQTRPLQPSPLFMLPCMPHFYADAAVLASVLNTP